MDNKDNSFLKLVENDNDTYLDLKFKNKKLREIIVRITEELKSIDLKYKTMQKENTIEKQILLDKLDKITKNYKLYAEGYKEKIILKKDIDTLINNYKQNNKVLNSFKDSFVLILKKNMNIYNECKKFESNINNDNNNNNNIINNIYQDFISDIKNKLLNNIIKFKKNIDMINFPEFYKEYFCFLENEEIQKKENLKNNNIDKSNSRSKSNKKNNNGNRRRSFGREENKYSFTKIELNTDKNIINQNNNNSYYYNDKNYLNNEEKTNENYKETNFYKNYCYDMNNNINNNNSNYINYFKYENTNNNF